MTRIKICGITNLEDALAAIDYGADALGFIFEKTSPRYIGNNPSALAIPEQLPPFVAKVAVYAHADNVRDYWESFFDAVQFITCQWITGSQSHKAIKVFQLKDENSALEIRDYKLKADAFLLDAYAADKFGGVGKTCDWDLAAEIVKTVNKPVILAGGLNPDNVESAIEKVNPFAVDVSSGVEYEPGIKDHRKLKDFINSVRQYDLNKDRRKR